MNRVAIVARDLIVASRISEAIVAAGGDVIRLDSVAELPPPSSVTAVFVDWADRSPDWGERLTMWSADAPQGAGPRLVLFGPHSDLAAHTAARAAGLGPMVARSKVGSIAFAVAGAIKRQAMAKSP